MQDTCNRGVTRVSQSQSSKRTSAQRESRRRRKWSAFFIACSSPSCSSSREAAPSRCATDALRYFNTFFITGDVVSGGVGLWNTGQGTINVGAAPAGAEPLGAFLYWQVVTSANPTTVDVNAGATFNGLPLNVPLGTQLQPTARGVELGTQACPATGGAGMTSPYVSRRCPVVPRHRPGNRSAHHQQGGRLPRRLSRRRRKRARRQPGRALSVSGSGSEAERHRHLRRHVREAAVGDAEAADRRLLRSRRTCPDDSPTLLEARRETWETRSPGRSPRSTTCSVPARGTPGTTSASRRSRSREEPASTRSSRPSSEGCSTRSTTASPWPR